MKNLILILIICLSSYCYGQTYIYDGQGNIIGGSHILTLSGKSIKLIDSTTNNYFILDSTHTIIECFDTSGKSMWKTNPHKDNKLDNYRTDKPYIVYFEFTNDYWCAEGFVEKGQAVIAISYVNTQFGVVNLKTGEFRFCGQD